MGGCSPPVRSWSGRATPRPVAGSSTARRPCAGAARRPASPCRYAERMCRNIRQLHNFDPPATKDEIQDAALQYVRKISGSNKPSKANEEAFDRAVREVTAATEKLLDSLVTSAPPKNREAEAAKRRAAF